MRKIALVVLFATLLIVPAGNAGEVSSQANPEAARKFKKTEFDAVVTNIKRTKNQVTVLVEGIEYRLTAPSANLAGLKSGDQVRVYLRGNGEDKIAWKLVKK